ncbi:MAG: Crp/Fnr family transcriptional regulator [Comamonadaceae bacterium]|nr:MAG: Crp/Fnr family transcriptional regulator [Comamonadaceae bacterium]
MRQADTCVNDWLAALPAEVFNRLQPHLRPSVLTRGQVLGEPSHCMSYVYFPSTALVSLLWSTSGGESLVVALTGSDGMVGVSTVGVPWGAPGRAVVHREGEALRLPMSVMQQEFGSGGALHELTLRYCQYVMAQMAQTALCSHVHTVDQQMCRWILTALDLCGSERLVVTQQELASFIGTRREGISSAAGRLHQAGVLYWGRGHITVCSRPRLETHCCECYASLRATSRRLFDFKRRAG